jgi:hypothetical protein
MEQNFNSIPLQYKYENFIIIFCNETKLIENICEYIKNRENSENIFIRYLKPNSEKYIIEDIYSQKVNQNMTNMENNKIIYHQEYFDELNEEEFLKKTKYIIKLDNDILKESFENLIDKYNLKIYVHHENKWEIEFFEYMLNETFEDNKKRRIKYIEDIKNSQNDINNQTNDENNNFDIIKINNKFSIQKEINILNHLNETLNINNKNKDNNKINIITYVRRMGDELLYNLQFKCILENYKNPFVENILVMGNEVEKYFSKINFEKIGNKKIILVNDDDDNITFKDLFILSNEIFTNQIVMLVRSDVIVLNNPEFENLYLDFLIHNRKIYTITRIERDMMGRFIRIAPNQNLFGGSEQDAWIYKTPIDIHKINNKELIENFDFNEKFSELYMNKYMIDNNYELINNSENLKVVRITNNPDLNIREFIKQPKQPLNKDNLYFLPDKSIINSLSFEQWLNVCQVSEDEKYYWKTVILNHNLKKKINIFF